MPGCGSSSFTTPRGPHVRHLPRGGRAPRAPVAARRVRRGTGPLRRPTRRDPAGGRPRRGGRGGGHPAYVALGPADQRAARGRRGAVPDPCRGPRRRAGRGREPVPGAPHPGRGGLMAEAKKKAAAAKKAPAKKAAKAPASTQADLVRATAAELARRLAAKEVSAVEVARAHLDRIADVDERVHAILHVDAEGALAAAAAVDEARARGEKLGPLAGVPVAVKDVMATRGVPTTAGSKILEGWRPPHDATIVTRMRQAGVVILAKTNMDEFALGSSTEYLAYGPTRNPWDLARIPGGSGGGSSAAIAAYEAPLAIGTDTGGSIRQPAAVTGTVGAKPTYGGVSRYGLIALASSLDQAGPCARTVLDAALLHEVIGGHDPCDSTSIAAPVPPVVAAAREGAHGDLKGLRVGVVKEL